MAEKTGLKGWFNMECMLHSDKHLPKETKITLAYGALTAARIAGEIDYKQEERIFGKFVKELYGLEIRE